MRASSVPRCEAEAWSARAEEATEEGDIRRRANDAPTTCAQPSASRPAHLCAPAPPARPARPRPAPGACGPFASRNPGSDPPCPAVPCPAMACPRLPAERDPPDQRLGGRHSPEPWADSSSAKPPTRRDSDSESVHGPDPAPPEAQAASAPSAPTGGCAGTAARPAGESDAARAAAPP
eukprot:CAMPEP_0172184726 /NCGR_PEP_ID=MMETSP1050-20130122/19743_1 /TAXON_ID=233186 /ORGANISM="Cryptomonas curvata, Strain CCAP979/52" /LENGTH=177 /DNA_ID=CAMNT_0012858571 /DNA_START=184 /DNA_END=715 /DNA_ORIENTATION=-